MDTIIVLYPFLLNYYLILQTLFAIIRNNYLKEYIDEHFNQHGVKRIPRTS